jgi:beta-lactam-binding protein with PASTA domain
MMPAKTHAVRDVIIHLALIVCLIVGMFLGFFFIYLPATTHHGKRIAVPDLKGKPLAEAEKYLSENDLRYEITDSTYIPQAEPMTILTQFPEAGAKVKEDRKIFLTVTTLTPPQVPMPDLVNLSLQNAEMVLKSTGLQLGEISKEPAFNTNVMRQEYQGRPIARKTRITKGARIDLVLGDGVGPVQFEMPIVLGKFREDAEILLRGLGLRLKTRLDYTSTQPVGTVIRQEPDGKSGEMIRRGTQMTIWVAARKAPVKDSLPADSSATTR